MKRTVAHAISWLLNPGFLLLGVLLLGVFESQLSHRAIWGWVGSLVFFSIIGSIILLAAWVHGIVLDAELRTPVNLKGRSQVLLAFLSLVLFMMIGTFRMGQPQPLHALLVAVLGIGLIVASITRVWKISLHMLGTSTFVTAVLLLDRLHWWPVVLIIPATAWARLRLGRHTPLQLLGGVLVGFSIVTIVFWVYGLL